MNRFSLQQVRTVAVETAVAVALEMAFVELARRLAGVRERPEPEDTSAKRHLARRTAAAVLVELREAGAAESRWQHSRMKAAVELAAARQRVPATTGASAHVPRQRPAPRSVRHRASHAAAS